MELSSWLTVAAVCATGAASPGPSLALVLRNTIRGGRSAGVATGLGHGLGVGIYAFAAVVGVSTLVSAIPGLHRSIELAGAAYLTWLAFLAWRHAGSDAQSPDQAKMKAPPQEGASDKTDGHSAFRQGFLIAFLNPKIAVFFLALLGSFLPEQASSIERAGVAGLAMGIDGAWYVFAALLLAGSGAASWLSHRAALVDRSLALMLLAVAVYLLLGLSPS